MTRWLSRPWLRCLWRHCRSRNKPHGVWDRGWQVYKDRIGRASHGQRRWRLDGIEVKDNAAAQARNIERSRAAINRREGNARILIIRLDQANGQMMVQPRRVVVQAAAGRRRPAPGVSLVETANKLFAEQSVDKRRISAEREAKNHSGRRIEEIIVRIGRAGVGVGWLELQAHILVEVAGRADNTAKIDVLVGKYAHRSMRLKITVTNKNVPLRRGIVCRGAPGRLVLYLGSQGGRKQCNDCQNKDRAQKL